MKVILGVVIGGVLLIGGCMAIVGGAANEVAKEMDKSSEASSGKQSSDGSNAKSNDPSVVGNWKIENMKQIKFAEEYGMFATVSLKVRNVSDDADTPWLAIRLTDKKGDLIAEYDCIGDEYEPGQGGTVRCSSLDDYAPFAEWEVKNAL